jgi:hypothetical protein
MSLYIAPQNIGLTPGSSAQFSVISTGSNLGSAPTFAPAVTGQVTFAQVSGDTTFQTWTITAEADAFASFPVAVTDSLAGETNTLTVTIAPNTTTTVPTGYTYSSLVYMVRLRACEPTLPSTSDIILLANAVLEQVELEVGGIRLVGTYPTVANQTTQVLTQDTQDVLSCSWSTGPFTAQGALVYPMDMYDQASFMDLAAGFPAVGFGPPVAYTLVQDNAGAMLMQLYPAAMIGQLNVYYRARPSLWTPSANTNLDTSLQEVVVVGTIQAVLEARGRSDEAKSIWEPRKLALIEKYVQLNSRRNSPKSGQVRDVTGRGYPAIWLGR